MQKYYFFSVKKTLHCTKKNGIFDA